MVTSKSICSWSTAIFVSVFLLAGCGSDGSDGAPGEPGPAGPPGPSGGAIPVTSPSVEKINVSIDAVEVLAGGKDVTVSLSLTNDDTVGLFGMPAGNIRFVISQLSPGVNGGSSEWQAYTTRPSVDDIQATTETATAGTYTDNGDGTYNYTFANALPDYPNGPTYDQTKTHRVGIEIRFNGIPANNAPTDFLPTGGDPTFTRLIVDNDTCNACHDNLEFHGDARFDIEYCVACHNPSSIDGDSGNTVDMKILIHNIHSARPDYTIFGFRGIEHNWRMCTSPRTSGTVRPAMMRVIRTLHRPVTGAWCPVGPPAAPVTMTTACPTAVTTLPLKTVSTRAVSYLPTTRSVSIATVPMARLRTTKVAWCRYRSRTKFVSKRPARILSSIS